MSVNLKTVLPSSSSLNNLPEPQSKFQELPRKRAHMAPQSCVYAAGLMAVLLFQCVSFSSAKTEAEILIKFRQSLGNKEKLNNWDPKTAPCDKNSKANSNWVGVKCHRENVAALFLDNMGLFGKIDVDSLAELGGLRGLSMMKNNFDGPFPNLSKLKHLKSVYFSGNRFSGQLDAKAFEGLNDLKKIQLSNNQLSGPIPASLASLNSLSELLLDGNKFTGEMPKFDRNKVKTINVAGNQLKV